DTSQSMLKDCLELIYAPLILPTTSNEACKLFDAVLSQAGRKKWRL
uniref:Uncharacterized protein n=1 Tax=Nothoprocta perdicaria TaxID=30464 RepID=A0A8C6YNL9_NOTPE